MLSSPKNTFCTGEMQQHRQQQQPDPMRPFLGSAADPLHPLTAMLLGSPHTFGNKLQKAALQDLIREDDARQMDALIAKLDAMRTMQAPAVPAAEKGPRRDAKGAALLYSHWCWSLLLSSQYAPPASSGMPLAIGFRHHDDYVNCICLMWLLCFQPDAVLRVSAH